MSNEVARLPMPEKLEPKNAKRSLLQQVRQYFYSAYNSDAKFREYLACVGNKDAVTGNRNFDRHEAVIFIKDLAKQAKDGATMQATDGEVYKCIVRVMRDHEDLNLKTRRIEFAKYKEAAE